MNKEDRQNNHELAARLISEQNFAAALIAGAAAAFLAAWAYGITVAKWPFSYGFAAAGIGVFVGLSIRFLGRGISSRFAIAASMYTIAGCLLGNVFRLIVELNLPVSHPAIDVLGNHTWLDLAEQSLRYFSLIDLVYWFVAVWMAAFLSRRSLSRTQRLSLRMFEQRE